MKCWYLKVSLWYPMIPIHSPVPTGSNYTGIIPVCPMEHGPIFKDLFTRNKTSYMRQYYKDWTSFNTSLIYFAEVLKLNHYYIKFKKIWKKPFTSHTALSSSFQIVEERHICWTNKSTVYNNRPFHIIYNNAIKQIYKSRNM